MRELTVFFFSFVSYRICGTEEDSASGSFLQEPDVHTFPQANLHSNRVLRVSVQSLPRCDIFNFTDEILACKINQLHAGRNCDHKGNEDLLECVDESMRSPLKKKSCIKQLDATCNHGLQTINGNNFSNKQNILDFSTPSTSRTLDEQARNCERNLLNSPKISQDLRGRFLKIRSLSEGTSGDSLHGEINQHCDKKGHYQPTCNSEAKQVRIFAIPRVMFLKGATSRGFCCFRSILC